MSTLAVFSAKKVDLQLFYLVFGESVVNDAVGLVLFDTCSKIILDEEVRGGGRRGRRQRQSCEPM